MCAGPSLQRQVLEHHLLSDAWSCVKDGESYPRASAITLATSLTGLPDWWAAFLQDTKVTEVCAGSVFSSVKRIACL